MFDDSSRRGNYGQIKSKVSASPVEGKTLRRFEEQLRNVKSAAAGVTPKLNTDRNVK